MKISKVLLFPLVLAVLWALLAFRSPTTTYHLAPLLVAVPFAYLNAGGVSGRVTVGLALVAGVATVVLASTLAVTGALEGPSLLPAGDALAEAAVGATVGAALGLTAALLPG